MKVFIAFRDDLAVDGFEMRAFAKFGDATDYAKQRALELCSDEESLDSFYDAYIYDSEGACMRVIELEFEGLV